MKPSVLLQNDQPKNLSRSLDKKAVSHNWNSRLFFQLGLIISLLLTGVVLESTIGLTAAYGERGRDYAIEEPPMITYVVEQPEIATVRQQKKEKPPLRKRQVVTSVIEPASNTDKVLETPVAPTIPTEDPSVTPYTNPVIPRKDNNPRNIMEVEFVPIFPGCEGLKDNTERVACMSKKVRSFISRKFNIDRFHYLESGSEVRIYVDFKIDRTGRVSEIVARAPDRKLEEEARRVIDKLPQMTPGRQSDMPVEVQYLVPITLNIQ